MPTYQEVAQNIINLYANYVEVCASNDENWEDYGEDIAIAVEALLIRADQERMNEMAKNAISQLSAVAPTPIIQPSVNEWIVGGKNLSDYPIDLNTFNSISYKEG